MLYTDCRRGPARFSRDRDILFPRRVCAHGGSGADRGLNSLTDRGNNTTWLVGRLKSGVTVSQAKADLDSIAAVLIKTYPKDDEGLHFALGRPGLVGDTLGGPVRAFVAGLMLLAGLILLAACANLGSLFSARAADRWREVALRLALGSSRGRILRQLLTEAVLVSLAARRWALPAPSLCCER